MQQDLNRVIEQVSKEKGIDKVDPYRRLGNCDGFGRQENIWPSAQNRSTV